MASPEAAFPLTHSLPCAPRASPAPPRANAAGRAPAARAQQHWRVQANALWGEGERASWKQTASRPFAGAGQRGSAAPLRRAAPVTRAVAAGAGAASGPKFGSQMLVLVPPHPLVKHWAAILRSAGTPSPVFRNAMAELGRILIYEAARDWLPTVEGKVETPCGVADVEIVDPTQPIAVVPILRAGSVLGEQMATTIPHCVHYHLGMVRDEETLQPSFYLNKLPETFAPGTRVLVLDCMLATGGTIVAALDEMVRRKADPSLIRVVSAIAAPPALKRLSESFPGLRVFTGVIDPELNDKGFIVPGLGDAGDRCFGTL